MSRTLKLMWGVSFTSLGMANHNTDITGIIFSFICIIVGGALLSSYDEQLSVKKETKS